MIVLEWKRSFGIKIIVWNENDSSENDRFGIKTTKIAYVNERYKF